MESGSRARAPNFTREEHELFTRVIEPYIRIIEAKKTDAVKQSDKQKAWIKITEVYNANTTQCSRTTDNLLYCYRNMKSKVKKQHSQAKMLLIAVAYVPVYSSWSDHTLNIKQLLEVCQLGFEGIKKEVKKTEILHKKKVMGTGGGPPAIDDDPFSRIKKMIEPQVDGLFTIHDSDSALMKQYQESIPETDRILPIETDFIKTNELILETDAEENEPRTQEIEYFNKDADHCDPCGTPQGSKKKASRIDILKKKSHSALLAESDQKLLPGKKSAKDCFAVLAEEKVELIKLNKQVAAEQLKECQLNVKLKESEITHKIKLQELELENMQKKYKHEEEMRQKEQLIMDLKIKSFNP